MMDVDSLTFIPGLTPDMTFRCHLDRLAFTVKDILALQIEKEEGGVVAPLAEIHVGSVPAIQATQLSSRMTVTGTLDHTDLKNSKLLVTLNNLQPTDEGHYICVITVVDMTGLIRTLTNGVNINYVQANMSTLLQAVMNFQKELKDVTELNKELVLNITDLQAQYKDLEIRMTSCENNMTSLTSKVLKAETRMATVDSTLTQMSNNVSSCCKSQSVGIHSTSSPMSQCPVTCIDRLDELAANVTSLSNDVQANEQHLVRVNNLFNYSLSQQHRVAFSVRYNELIPGDESVPLKTPIIFDKEFINTNNVFDMSTGTFTAPEDGTYMFQVGFPVRGPDPQVLYRVVLTLNNFDALAQIESGGPSNNRSLPAPTSELYVLKAKDTINLYVYQILGSGTAVPTVSRYAAFFLGFWLH